jgi:hypothetical protein
MATSTSVSTHSTNMNALTHANVYSAKYETTASANLVVVFGDENFKKTGPNTSSVTGQDIIGAFDSKDLDFMFLKPNNKYDFYRSAGTKEDDSTAYDAVNAGGSNTLTNLIDTASASYSGGSIRYLGLGLSGSFAALWYSLNVTHTYTPDRCVITQRVNKLPSGFSDVSGASDEINAINNLPGYNSAVYNIASNGNIDDMGDCDYYLPGSGTSFPASGYTAGTGESDVWDGAFQNFDGWGEAQTHITVRSNMTTSWYTDTFDGIGNRSS